MLRFFTLAITTFSLLLATSLPAFAQDNRFANNAFSNQNSAQARAYLKIPLTGGLKKTKRDKMQFGASLGFKREYSTNFNSRWDMQRSRKSVDVNFLDLKFNERGFKTVSLAGQDLRGLKHGDMIWLEDKDGTKKKSKAYLYVIGGVVVFVAAGLIWANDFKSGCWFNCPDS